MNPAIDRLDAACFDGVYVTGDVTPAVLAAHERGGAAEAAAPQSRLRLREPEAGAFSKY